MPTDIQTLKKLVNLPETHHKIVGDYEGSYSLGVTDNPPAFVLRVEPDDVTAFPHRVRIGRLQVPVVVTGGFVRPRPLSGR